ncbi:Helix-turn-helix domain-containing protein [Chitinophaga ginsengisegetis]|uniref:Helix-turn-helix domain-containing protein n=1 Tax=Chitinophaga ginsengisegetis TaxID=393003 RepID=A0A1T5N578_9BACT|nr:response regulator [Chitinophaga ginsengisegetis]MDR6568773.1 DNA-binding response OmpR family regulator [Chitinophaga ginsengisegetis]MDR6647996.1 DNA-binding response OmpR family regulator [Chitinophaga ginsengisegetis]MDR6654854.1 DNA-binding response OmpR family regulator [Chitinophaga ginsengisegetis]SKC95630.1 Helix-turn-helix domain-containing protein [Chitinophaga ginsengisegetis]
MTESILIIDDNEDILEFLSVVLGDAYRLHLATNGEIAQTILDKEIIHLIISDIMMPGIDGFELCRLIKSNVEYCHIPIILLTSKNTYKAHIEGLEVGADAYIQKPFSSELLQVQIANLLKNRRKIKDHFASSPFEDVRVMAHSKTDEAFLKKLDEYIRANIKDSNIDIDMLAGHMFMSRTTLYRKIKSLSSLSPKELIDITRLKTAANLIARNEFSFYEISKMIGYSSQSLFSRNFQKYFKMSPNEYFDSLPRE